MSSMFPFASMCSEFEFVENKDGVHLVEVVDSEYTLCGQGLAGTETDHRDTHKKVVTCPDCIAYLKALSTVKFREKEAA